MAPQARLKIPAVKISRRHEAVRSSDDRVFECLHGDARDLAGRTLIPDPRCEQAPEARKVRGRWATPGVRPDGASSDCSTSPARHRRRALRGTARRSTGLRPPVPHRPGFTAGWPIKPERRSRRTTRRRGPRVSPSRDQVATGSARHHAAGSAAWLTPSHGIRLAPSGTPPQQ